MRFVCISDTHDRQDRIVVPDGDVLLHAGDLTMKGDLPEIVTAFEWLSKLPHERIVFVPGNHDFAFQDVPETTAGLAARFPRVTILIDRAIVIGTFRIYGSPYQPWFHDWAFNFSPGEAGRSEAVDRWALIPGDTEILITHGPVRGILDRTFRGEPVGCPELRARIEDLRQLRLHVCGHIHEAYGSERHRDVLYVNASSCDLKYRPTQPPIVVDLDPAPGPP